MVSMIMEFFMAYKEEGSDEYETNFDKIYKRYLFGDFAYDLFILIPWGLLGLIPKWEFLKILHLIKIVRIRRLTEILDQKFINPILRSMKANKTARILQDSHKRDD